MSARTIGTHNLGDNRGTPTPFADIIGFTEAIPKRVRKALRKTHRLYVCGLQRDLIIAIRRDLDVTRVVKHYRPVHPGVRKVTPHRGTYWLTFLLDGVPSFFLVEHRINASFPPWKRGERWLRSRWWAKHDRITDRILDRLEAKGRHGAAVGDTNTTPSMAAYPGRREFGRTIGHGFDRVTTVGWVVSGCKGIGRKGSDHQRVRAFID